MNLFDDSTAHNLDSSIETMTTAHDTHTGGPAVIDAPEPAQPSPTEALVSAAPEKDISEISAPVQARGPTTEYVLPEWPG